MFQCVHCDEQALVPLFSSLDSERAFPFCCLGCLTVYEVLKQKNLTSYYDIKNNSGVFKRRAPVDVSRSSFLYLDDEKFQKEHCYLGLNNHRVMDFYLEGIHCLACLWLIEKMPQITPGVTNSKLDIEKSVASITISKEGKFSEVARELNRLGYRPHALSRSEDLKKFQQQEERNFLKRLGVAGAAAGNIMIYSVSLYGGASENIGKIFNTLTVVLAIPVFTYSAWPFYQSAWTSFKNKTLSIDIPIAMSLIMGFVMGVRGLALHHEENYFDSLTALVFLLLLSRYFLKKIQDRGLAATDLHYFYQNESVLRKTESGFEEIHTEFINKGDIIKVCKDDFIPADGEVLEGDTYINNSLLSGESVPDHVRPGQFVFSGTQNMGADILVRVEKTNKESRLGNILRNVEQGWALRSRTVDVTSTVAKYFTVGVILLALVLFLTLLPEHGTAIALQRAMTLLIVTCPCALAISVPLTFHRSLSEAARHGIIVKSDEVFEKLTQSKMIFLDKTGTITLGKLQVENFTSSKNILDIVYTLEKDSRHPVGKALSDFALQNGAKATEIKDHLEVPGKGVSGNIESKHYEITAGQILEDGNVVGSFTVRDSIRKDSGDIISRLQSFGHKIAILSGDKNQVVQELARESGVLSAFAEISPEEKVEMVKTKGSVMVGDGANDAMALEGAEVGIAVSGAMDIALRASDVYLTTPGLAGVEKLLVLSRETMKVVRRNLVLSIIYNLTSVIFVFTGLINPLVAAIVMPVSSLTVLISTIVGTKQMRALWKS